MEYFKDVIISIKRLMLTLHIADDIDDDFKVILYYQKLIDYIL